MMFRGDKSPPVVEEYKCGPLPDVQVCQLIRLPGRKNPVPFAYRPYDKTEFHFIDVYILKPLNQSIYQILMESYNSTFCLPPHSPACLTFGFLPVGTAFLGDSNKRRAWMSFSYDLPFSSIHPVDFGILINLDDADASRWRIEKLWYAGQMFNSVGHLIDQYQNNKIHKIVLHKLVDNAELFSSLQLRGDPVPQKPQRPPLQVEPDGKRYSLVNREVTYMNWKFNFRMSALTGPVLYNVRFKGERLVYEMGLQEIAVFYSGPTPLTETINFVDSGDLLGTHSKSLIPGGDCPEHSTLVNQTFWNQHNKEVSSYDATFCLFEHNTGYPLRRHSSYSKQFGSFYGGMLNSVLTLRSALTIGNYDYIIDFIFHQNGIIETRLMSTGYIVASVFSELMRPYAFQLKQNIVGPVHHHMAHFKVDLDVSETINRFETLDIVKESVFLKQNSNVSSEQIQFVSSLKETELDAVYDYNFRTPKYLVVHNNNERTEYGAIKAYRVQLNGMSPSLVNEDVGHERTIPWARHQMVVTKHKESEQWSSSNYGMFDSLDPVVNFTQFYSDDENIVDEDLVLWISAGLYHIPHTEDLPVTPTVGNHLSFFLLPYNYFPECPSMGSRDAMYIEHLNKSDYSQGVRVERNGNSRNQCVTRRSTLEELLAQNPDMALETNRVDPNQ
ncbi:putative amine oxidase [copper-containing] isoform X2 [Biomphalaria glabrata]|nr:putative amine oxidase [copper-containing] isoform X2 [Biomphalaria glabrata]XP_055860314.1 putative amine oxidase [copper-containing] isoform X2 [Biomphalaria glabrata]